MAALEFGNGGLPPEPTGATHATGRPRCWDGLCKRCRGGSVERVTTGAGALRVRVVDGEALGVDAVREVDGGTGEVRRAHPVHDHLDTVEVGDDVAVERPLVEEQLVSQAGAATGLHGDAQAQVIAPFLIDQGLDLDSGNIGQDDAGRRGGRGGLGRLAVRFSGHVWISLHADGSAVMSNANPKPGDSQSLRTRITCSIVPPGGTRSRAGPGPVR